MQFQTRKSMIMRIYKMMFLPHVKFIIHNVAHAVASFPYETFILCSDFQTFFTRNSIHDGIVVYIACFKSLNQSKVIFWFGPIENICFSMFCRQVQYVLK